MVRDKRADADNQIREERDKEMGTRSDVGFAVKKELADKIESLHPWIHADADEVLEHELGKLYVFRDIRWNDDVAFLEVDDSEYVAKFVAWLKEQDRSMFLLVDACFDYPSDDAVIGQWLDNPWNLHSRITIEILFNEV